MSVWSDNPEWFDDWATIFLYEKLWLSETQAYEIEDPWDEIQRLMPYTWDDIAVDALQDYYERYVR